MSEVRNQWVPAVRDVTGPRRGAFDGRARARHDAWPKATGLLTGEAMARRCKLVARLSSGWRPRSHRHVREQ